MSDPITNPPWPVMSIAQAHARLTAPGERLEIEVLPIRGIPTRVWKNAPPTLRHVFLTSRTFPDREFLIYDDERATYDAFRPRDDRAGPPAPGRRGEEGRPGRGDHAQPAGMAVAFFAGVLAGAIVTPLNAWWTGAELEYGLADSGAKVAIVDDERLGRISDYLDSPGRPETGLCLAPVGGRAAPEGRAAGRRDRSHERLEGSAGPAAARRRSGAGGRRDHPLHLRTTGSRKARSAPIAT